jgi:hypothetical protein
MSDLQGGINYLCQRCQQPLRLSTTLYSMDEHTLAELSLPISPAQNIDIASQVARVVLGAIIPNICRSCVVVWWWCTVVGFYGGLIPVMIIMVVYWYIHIHVHILAGLLFGDLE